MGAIEQRLSKYTLSIDEEGGLVFASSPDFSDLFIAVKSRDDLRVAIETCLSNAFATQGQRIRVYMGNEFGGRTVDAVVERLA